MLPDKNALLAGDSRVDKVAPERFYTLGLCAARRRSFERAIMRLHFILPPAARLYYRDLAERGRYIFIRWRLLLLGRVPQNTPKQCSLPLHMPQRRPKCQLVAQRCLSRYFHRFDDTKTSQLHRIESICVMMRFCRRRVENATSRFSQPQRLACPSILGLGVIFSCNIRSWP